jgi:hypothetical protein
MLNSLARSGSLVNEWRFSGHLAAASFRAFAGQKGMPIVAKLEEVAGERERDWPPPSHSLVGTSRAQSAG